MIALLSRSEYIFEIETMTHRSAGVIQPATLHDATDKILRRLPLKPSYVQAALKA